MRIFIVGYMGAGKSTVGKRLARKLDLPFIDLDDAFEQKYRYSIPNFFDHFGEEKFRELEHQLLNEIILNNQDAVISTGGGTASYFNNMELINDSGLSVYLKMSALSISHRLKMARKLRPVIREVQHEDMLEFIKKQLAERELFYNKARLSVKGENFDLEHLVEQIIAVMPPPAS